MGLARKTRRGIPAAVKRAEDLIERQFENFPVLSVHRDTAAYHVLTAFEDGVRFSACRPGEGLKPYPLHEAVVRFKHGLFHLVPKLFDRCSVDGGGGTQLDDELYGQAGRALRFAADYSGFAAMMFHAYNGRCAVRLKQKTLTFEAPRRAGTDRDALSHLVREYTADRLVLRAQWAGIMPQVPFEEVVSAISRTVKAAGAEAIEYSPARAVVAFADQLANSVIPPPKLPPEVGCGGYTLTDFLAVWRCLSRLALVHHLYCLYSGMPGHARASAVIQSSVTELPRALGLPAVVPGPAVERILSDLVYDNSKGLRDAVIQPFVPVSAGKILIAPHLILTSNWEECLLRVWSRKYRDEYGQRVASGKGALAQKWESLFKGRGFLTAAQRVLRDRSGKPITDVDVAVFDEATNFLALFEVKWLIEVDTAREIRDADDELEHGLQQLDTAERFARAQPTEFLLQVFSKQGVAPKGNLSISKMVVCLGHVGTHVGVLRDAVILAYPVARDFLANPNGVDLGHLCEGLASLMDEPEEGQAYRSRYEDVQLAGFSVRLPVFEIRGGLSKHAS